MSLQKIPRESFEPEVLSLLLWLTKELGEICLIGGVVRDYLSSGVLGNDIDLEVRPWRTLTEVQWREELKRAFIDYNTDFLPMNVVRVKFAQSEVELTLPRMDVYDETRSTFGHSDFNPTFSCNYSYHESFSRRDLSCNAVGLVIEKEQTDGDFLLCRLIDPFAGAADIKNKILRPVSAHFSKDPVRWLRLIRFHLKSGFGLEEKNFPMREGDLSQLTFYYFSKELFKNNFLVAINILFGWIEKYKWKHPAWLGKIIFLREFSTAEVITNVDELLCFLLNEKEMTQERFELIGEVFQIKMKLVKSLAAINTDVKQGNVENIVLPDRQKVQLKQLEKALVKFSKKNLLAQRLISQLKASES